jgi:probable phosphoglycerate mutase
MKRLYFIRHGESEFNKANVWNGSSDTPLTKKGHEQAKQAGRKAEQEGLAFDIIITSPLERAHETAKHVATATGVPHDQIIIYDHFVERDFGKLEGRKDLVATTKYFLDESDIDSYENVERLADLQKRADKVLADLQSLPHDTILIVGHGAIGRALRRAINKEPLGKRGKSFDNAELVRFI